MTVAVAGLRGVSMTVLDTGWHKDIDIFEYHHGKLKDRFSSSDMRKKSPAHIMADKYGDEKITPALQFGSALHTAATDGIGQLLVEPSFDRRTKQGKADHADWLVDVATNHADKTHVTQDDYDTIQDMLAAVQEHPIGAAMLSCQDREITGIFESESVPCKIRPDFYDADKQIIYDLKSTISADVEDFTKSIFNFGYHVQAAFYSMGHFNIENLKCQFVIVAVEKSEPYGVNAFHIAGDALEYGYGQVFRQLYTIAECLENHKWPGYEPRLHTVTVPGWVK